MIKRILIFILFFCIQSYFGQKIYTSIKDENNELIVKFSGQSNEKLLQILDSITLVRYYTLRLDSIQKLKDDKIVFITKGKSFSNFNVTLSDTLSYYINYRKVDVKNIDSLKKNIQKKLEQKGFVFHTLKTKINQEKVFLDVILQKKRKIDGFEFNGYQNLNKNFKRQINSLYLNKTLNELQIQSLNKFLNETKQISLNQAPQILYLKDSTILFLNLKKRKNSSFDGIIGFGNTEDDKFKLNGNINLTLNNVFNGFENIDLKWISSNNGSQDFKFRINLPYLYKNYLGTESNLSIFRQDSTFVDVSFSQKLYYNVSNYTAIGIEGKLISSTFLNNDSENFSNGEDYSKTGLGVYYNYLKPSHFLLFENKFFSEINLNFFNTNYELQNTTEVYEIKGIMEYLHSFNNKHHLLTNLSYRNLLNNTPVANELFRLGGPNSLRGFNPLSIYANAYISSTIEYRYLPNENLYFAIFTDFASLKNKILDDDLFLFGSGIGLHFLSKLGIFSIEYAIGKFPNIPVKFGDSKIHIGVKALF